MIPLYVVLLSPLVAAALSALSKRQRHLAVVAAVTTLLELVAALLLVKGAAAQTLPHTGLLAVDSLGAIVLATVAIIGFSTALYSIGYLHEEVAKGIIGFRRVRQYFVLVHLFLFAMFFAITTTAPMLMWIAIEATTLATAFLVSFYNKRSAMEAAWKYLIINSVGLLLSFLGTLLYFTALSTIGSSELVTWDTLRGHAFLLDPLIAKISFVMVLVGYGTKIGLAPMHTWKPDVYSKAPTPVVALFSGALLNVALLALLRFKGVTDTALQSNFTDNLFIGFGLVTVLLAAIIILTQWNYKRMLAYSSIEHAGLIVLGFGFGGIAAFAAILHMVYHSLAKTILFFAAGNMFLKYSSTKIDRVQGLFTTIPVTTTLLCISFFAVVGMPPFGIFFTELYLVLGGIESHPYVTGAFVLGLALVFVGFLKQLTRMLYGTPPEDVRPGEAHYLTVLTPLALVVLLVIAGLYLPDEIRALLIDATRSL